MLYSLLSRENHKTNYRTAGIVRSTTPPYAHRSQSCFLRLPPPRQVLTLLKTRVGTCLSPFGKRGDEAIAPCDFERKESSYRGCCMDCGIPGHLFLVWLRDPLRRRVTVMKLNCISNVIFVLLILVSFASADSIQLRNGRHLQGKYIGGTSTVIGFMSGASIEYFATTDVLALIFDSGTESPLGEMRSPKPMSGALAAKRRASSVHIVRAHETSSARPAVASFRPPSSRLAFPISVKNLTLVHADSVLSTN
jgi:hypothetical protein